MADLGALRGCLMETWGTRVGIWVPRRRLPTLWILRNVVVELKIEEGF
jgi:hypothetical protein